VRDNHKEKELIVPERTYNRRVSNFAAAFVWIGRLADPNEFDADLLDAGLRLLSVAACPTRNVSAGMAGAERAIPPPYTSGGMPG